MRLMRISLAAVALITAWTLAAQAQRHRDDTSHFRERVRNALKLTEEQRESLRALRDDLAEQLEALRDQVQEGALTGEDTRVHYRRAMRAQRAGRDEILTEGQRALLERARRFVEVDRLADPRNRQRPHARLTQALELTDAQKAQWRELLQDQRRRVQKSREEGEVVSREDIRRLRGEHSSAFTAILRPEQVARLEEIREDWRRRREADRVDAAEFGIEVDGGPGTAVEKDSWGLIKSRSEE